MSLTESPAPFRTNLEWRDRERKPHETREMRERDTVPE